MRWLYPVFHSYSSVGVPPVTAGFILPSELYAQVGIRYEGVTVISGGSVIETWSVAVQRLKSVTVTV